MLAHLIIHALEETVEQVVKLMKHAALTFVFLVVNEGERHGCVVPILPESIQSFLLIYCVNDQGLEVKEVKASLDLWEQLFPRFAGCCFC